MQIDVIGDAVVAKPQCMQKVRILPGPRKMWLNKQIDVINEIVIGKFYCI